jgi:hypothetical protein
MFKDNFDLLDTPRIISGENIIRENDDPVKRQVTFAESQKRRNENYDRSRIQHHEKEKKKKKRTKEKLKK